MTPTELYRIEREKRMGTPAPVQPASRPRTPHRLYSGLPYKCGHARTPENTYTNKRTQVTSCLTCRRRRSSRKVLKFPVKKLPEPAPEILHRAHRCAGGCGRVVTSECAVCIHCEFAPED